MKKLCLILSIFITFGANAAVEDELNMLILKNMEATQNENIKVIEETMHTEAPSKAQTINMMKKIFSSYELKYSLLDFNFVATDHQYAYVRTTLLTEKVSGPQFNNNEIETLQVFKRENEEWKLWTQAILSINFK